MQHLANFLHVFLDWEWRTASDFERVLHQQEVDSVMKAQPSSIVLVMPPRENSVELRFIAVQIDLTDILGVQPECKLEYTYLEQPTERNPGMMPQEIKIMKFKASSYCAKKRQEKHSAYVTLSIK